MDVISRLASCMRNKIEDGEGGSYIEKARMKDEMLK